MTNKTITTRRGTKVFHGARGYTYRAYKNKKQIYFPLGNDRATALRTADDIRAFLTVHSVQKAREKFHPGHVDKSIGTTYGEFKRFFRENAAPAIGLSADTPQSYFNALGRVIRHGKGRRDIDSFDVADFEPRWLDSLRLELVRGARDAEDVVKKKRTFNTILRQVKSLFTPDAVDIYKAQGWTFGYCKVVRDMRPFRRVKKIWVSPDEDLIHEVHKGIDELSGDQYVAAAFALHAGLRRKEILHVSRDWFQHTGGEHRLWVIPSKEFQQKGRPGFTVMAPHILKRIERECVTRGGRYLKRVSRRAMNELTHVLRQWFDVDKPLHELRRLFGMYVTNKFDLWTAQNYLRHESPQVTFDSYAGSAMSKSTQRLWANHS